MHAGPSDRPDPLAALYRVRGVADLTKGVVALACAWVRFHPHHISPLLLLVSLADLSSRHLTSTIANVLLLLLISPLFSFSFLLPLQPPHLTSSYYYFLSSILSLSLPSLAPLFSTPSPAILYTLILRIAHSRSNPDCRAGSKRNYSYLPPTLLDSRLFRGSRPPSLPHCPSPCLAILFLFLSISLSLYLALSPGRNST